jgi:hypothetical protein
MLAHEVQTVEKAFLNCCRKAMAAGADVLIPGEGELNEFVFKHKLTQCDGAPILDANAALWNYGIMLANLRTKSNITVSRSGFGYLKPDNAMMEHMQGFHKLQKLSPADFS